jgi:hypothetical protein
VLPALRVPLALSAGNQTDVGIPKNSACPLAGWLRHPDIRLEQPSLRANRYVDWTPNTSSARGVMTTGYLQRPICQNGGSITRSLRGHFDQLAMDVAERRVRPPSPSVPGDGAPDPLAAAPSGVLR